jgi:hypothetical protein
MKTLLTFYIILTVIGTGYAQTVIKGKITDAGQTPIPGANILLQNTYDGTSSDANGDFSFETSASGERVLVVRFVGYKEHTEKLNLQRKILTLEITLHEEINELDAVTITAGAFTASDQARRTIFKAVDIATTAGATADIAGALNTLPGTQKVGESGRLFVRGGDGSETRTFIDGMVVQDAYGPSAPNTPSRGRFLPFMFKGTSFSTGGYSSEYGQALSSALVLDSKDETEATRTDIGILSVGGDVAHTQAWSGGSVAGKVQYTNIRPYFSLINQTIDWKKAPASLEGVAAFRQRVGKTGLVKVYGNFNQADFSLFQHDIDNYSNSTLFDLKNRYRYFNTSYKTLLSENWSFRSGASYSYVENDVLAGLENIVENKNGLHLKAVIDGSVSSAIELKTGAEVMQRNYRQTFSLSPGDDLRFDEWITAFFAEADLYASNKFISRIGGRTEFNSMTRKLSVDPRISLAYKLSKSGQVSFAYGKFRQAPDVEYLKFNTELDNEKAEHFILNYQRIVDKRTFRIETFYKKYEDLVKFDEMPKSQNNGRGFAKGIELFWRDNSTINRLDYWVSYSFLDTERDYLNYPHQATPSFASRHNFSLVTKYFIQSLKSQVGATYSFSSGRPYNDPNQENFNGSRTPSYQDLSFNWSYLPKPHLILYLSCTNILGRDNIFGYEYSKVKTESGVYNGRAVGQSAPRFIFLGIFITLSKNKSFNQLPSL